MGPQGVQTSALDRLNVKFCAEGKIPLTLLNLVYEKTPNGCILQRYLVEMVAFTADLREN